MQSLTSHLSLHLPGGGGDGGDSEDQGLLEVTKIHADSWPGDNFPSNAHSLKLHFMKLLAKQTGRDGKTTNSPFIQGINLLNRQGHHRSLFHTAHEGATQNILSVLGLQSLHGASSYSASLPPQRLFKSGRQMSVIPKYHSPGETLPGHK